MGGSKSKTSVTTENDTTIVNRSDINILNQNLNSVTANVVQNTDQTCESRVNLSNVIDFTGAEIGGDFNIGTDTNGQDCQVDLTTNAAITFQCVNASEMVNDIGSKMIDEMMNKIEQSSTTDALTKMQNQADSQAKTGTLGIGFSGSSSNSTSINKFKQVNDNRKSIQNVVGTSVANNLTENKVAKCISSVSAKQGISSTGAKISGNVNICNYKSDVVADLFVSCLNEDQTTSKITDDIVKNLGVKVNEDSQNKLSTDQTNQASSSATVSGIDSIFGSLGSAFLTPFALPLSGLSLFLCCCCCCILLILIIVGVFMASNSESGKQLTSTAADIGSQMMMQKAINKGWVPGSRTEMSNTSSELDDILLDNTIAETKL